jgi:small-conductance mechanosensitive channel
MSAENLTTNSIVAATAFLVGAVLLGILGRYLLSRRMARKASREDGSTKNIVLGGLQRVFVVLTVIAGAYGAAIALPLRPPFEQSVRTVLLAAATLTGTAAAARITGGLVDHFASRHQRLPGASSIFANIARFVVLAIGFLMTLQTVGISVGPMLTALGVGGLAVALALQDTLANLFAGLHVIGSRKVVPGDYVLMDSGEEGYVEDINWRNTSMRNLRNNVIVVPNARLASAIVTNYSQPATEMVLLVPLAVGYESDLGEVEAVTIDVGRRVMREVEGGVPEHEPIIRYHTFDESSINFNVILRVTEHTNQYLVKHEFVKGVHDRYRREGIEIPYPVQVLMSRDGRDEQAIRTRAGELLDQDR